MSDRRYTANGDSLGTILQALLPFDSPWTRYTIGFCLLASMTVAGWAGLVVRSQTEARLSAAAPLLDLERQAEGDGILRAELEVLREQESRARAALFPTKEAADLALLDLIAQSLAQGWTAVLAAEEQSEASPSLTRAFYQLELNRPFSTAASEPRPVTAEVLGFLQSVNKSRSVLDIARVEIAAEEGRSAKLFVTLVAHIAK